MNNLSGFIYYLQRTDTEIFEVFGGKDDLGLYPDPNIQGKLNLATILGSEYYTPEQYERLVALWNGYQELPVGS